MKFSNGNTQIVQLWININLLFREFGRWKVNNLAVERRNFLGSPLPLAPEFFRNIRLLGRRPTLQQITENLIKKYGTHFLLSATLGGRSFWNICASVCLCINLYIHSRKTLNPHHPCDSFCYRKCWWTYHLNSSIIFTLMSMIWVLLSVFLKAS